MKSSCPICRKEFESQARGGPFPFCSFRCKKLDLYQWLNERYAISEPVEFAAAAAHESDDAVKPEEASG
jgi:endogenous inhibitor of DNA gyrase (YacG/DUF329 family)